MAHGAEDWYTLTWAILTMDFITLSDTPSSYIGHDGEVPVVDEALLELVFKKPTPAAHKTSHQKGGSDEIDVTGLSGELADNQKSTFLKLSDTPVSYAGKSQYFPRVNTGETALELIEAYPWYKVYDTVLTSATQYVTISGLSGDTDIWYLLICRIVAAGGVGRSYSLRLNNDGAAHYAGQGLAAIDNAVTASRAQARNAMDIADVPNNGWRGLVHCLIHAESGHPRQSYSYSTYNVEPGADMLEGLKHFAYMWENTTSEVTSIVLCASDVDGWGADSRIELWARK